MSTTTLPPYVFPNPEIPQALLNHPNLFTIQEHAATRHHWDLRLRVRARNASDGDTLRSWAVPKGPSYVVGSRTLAMETEDHDVGYAIYEGVIPRDHYGGGTVMVWDLGTYTVPIKSSEKQNESTTETEEDDVQGRREQERLERGLAKGHVTIQFNGRKLNGVFTLHRLANTQVKAGPSIRRREQRERASATASPAPSSRLPSTTPDPYANTPGKRPWLLIRPKPNPKYQSSSMPSSPVTPATDITSTHPLSVLTGRSIWEIAREAGYGHDIDKMGHWKKVKREGEGKGKGKRKWESSSEDEEEVLRRVRREMSVKEKDITKFRADNGFGRAIKKEDDGFRLGSAADLRRESIKEEKEPVVKVEETDDVILGNPPQDSDTDSDATVIIDEQD